MVFEVQNKKNWIHVFFLICVLLKEYQCTHPKYDYIIVGAGSAGATLASRLSEDSDVKVLLLEAGAPPPKATEIPLLLTAYGEVNSIVNWNYTVEPHEGVCKGSINNTCPYYMGKTLGGSSQVNYMLYVHGNRIDYDLWEKNGADGWGYDDVLPYFKKSEKVEIKNDIIEKDFHGTKGPLTVSESPFSTPLKNAYLDALRELKYSILDYNGKVQKGFSAAQLTVRNGYRCSTEKAFLQPAVGRKNLEIITEALVTKVNFDKLKRRATGVSYEKNGGTFEVYAKREVILSAGAVKSPQLLMLSGIGPKKHLKEMKIDPIVVDLPVGLNLQDHIQTGVTYVLNVSNSGIPTLSEVMNYTSQKEYQYPKKLTGVLSSPNILEVFGYDKSPYETVKGDYNDLQYFFVSILGLQEHYKQQIKDAFKDYLNMPGFVILPTHLHPKSRGEIKLKTTNPRDAPIIRMNYLTDPQDIKVLIHGLKKTIAISESNALKKFNPIPLNPIPGCEQYTDYKSDEYVECVIRTATVSTYHACGTCKMGRRNDPSAVVDSNLRVYGVAGLRVVDASIMPTIVSANTNAPTIMIAEKAADIIKRQKGIL